MYELAFQKFTLSNGLQVVLHEDHALPTVGVNLWYHVGSKNEEAGRTGFAHLFEHVMFEGSKNHNRLYFEPLQKIGAAVNGSTSSDKTNYWETVPSDHLELALWLESDRMGFLLDALDQKRFDVQRDVVKNERRQSYENRPYGMAYLLLQPALFPPPHPYSWPVIGSQEDLDAAHLDDVKDFFRRFYSPSNASLTLAGDIDGDEARKLVERYFGDIEPAPAVGRIGRMDSTLTGEVRLDLRDRVQLPRLYLVWPAPPMFDPAEAPLDVLAAILGEGKSSRLYRSLVYEKQIARDVSVSSHAQEIAGEFDVMVTANPGHTLEELQDVVEEELDRVRREPPTEREVERTINMIESDHVRQLQHVGGFGGRADQFNHYNVFAGDPGELNSALDRYRAVTPDDVLRVARQALGPDRVRMSVLPQDTPTASKSEVDRTSAPSAGIVGKFSPPTPARHTLSNGLDILFVEKRGLPLVSAALVVRAGGAGDPEKAPGTAQITAAMLAEGTSSLTSVEIADEMEFMGSSLSSSASREHAVVGAQTLTAHWARALEIAADVVRNPSFPDHELDRVRNERLADLRRIGDNAAGVAERAVRGLVYGPDTPSGHPMSGTIASVEALTRDALTAHHAGSYVPDGSTLVVVGDTTEDEVISEAESLFGDWTGKAPDAPASAASDALDGTTIFIADRPGAPQSMIRAGHLAVPRSHPDFYGLTLVNYAFGAHPSARLFMNLRQDKGYSYGYYSSVDWGSQVSALFAGGAVETSVTKESVIETLKEFADIRGDRPVTQEEYDDSRDGISRGFPAQFETHGQIMTRLVQVALFRLPDDYYADFLGNIAAVGLERLNELASRHIDDKRLAVLVVGDREAIEPGLRELGMPIVPVDFDGRRVE